MREGMDRLDKRIGAMTAGPNNSKAALAIQGIDAVADTATQAGLHASHCKLIRPYLDAYGAAFITPTFRRHPSGRDECCPYHRLPPSWQTNEPHPQGRAH